MPRSAVFTSSVTQSKKPNKLNLLWLVFVNIVKNNLSLFLWDTCLAIVVAAINFNVRLNLYLVFSERPASSILDYKKFNLVFLPFGRVTNLSFWSFFLSFAILALIAKGIFSLFHYYWMNYAYDRIENDLVKDLFKRFLQAKYSHSSQVARYLPTQFILLDRVARDIWFIANRTFYVLASLIFLSGNFVERQRQIHGTPWRFITIIFFLFSAVFIIQYFLFKRAIKLNVVKKQRYEEENRHIFERINNLEYTKANSGEEYEERKLNKLLDQNFQKNKKSLLWSVFFQAIPQYILIPNVSIFFVLLSGLSALWLIPSETENRLFFFGTFYLIYSTVYDLRNETEKIVQSLAKLDELSSDLFLVIKNVQILEQNQKTLVTKNLDNFCNGDIVFNQVVFSYPDRLETRVLRNFSFSFRQGEIYGIAGKNGIGKSTIVKTLLKIYDLQEGEITIDGQNIQEIETKSLKQRICYLTNRPSFFQMTIWENVFYPYDQNKEEALTQLKSIAHKVGISQFIDSLPLGFETEIREKGGNLSEGQKQQIDTLRAFIRDYDIYVFDEILSNVQVDLKARILANIFAHLKGKTVIVIDHHYDIFWYVSDVYRFTGENLVKLNKEDLLAGKDKQNVEFDL